MSGKKPDVILEKLENAGFEAYYVGGCVRDTLLGRPVSDWDITTSALPEETMAVFSHSIPTGIRHGTITVLEGGAQAEVTTYRCDGTYADGRHPDQVAFVRNLKEDLARRDFTVNTMAMNRTGELTDLYGGREDLQKKVLRCVGEPDRRFQEDALRMLRAMRFSAQLGFAIEPETLAAVGRCAALCGKLSAERVRDEVEKTLLSPRPQVLSQMSELGLLKAFGLEGPLDCGWLADLPTERAVRWAGLCHTAQDLNLILFRLDKQTTRNAMAAAHCTVPTDRLGWKQLLSREGREVGRLAAALSGNTPMVEEILSSGECLTLKDLAVSGKDLPHRGRTVGELLQRLLDHVLIHPKDNVRETLLEYTAKILEEIH